MLSEREAILLVLYWAKNNVINSQTKLNKLVARLNLRFIPVNVPFELNKYGSYDADLGPVTSDDYCIISSYNRQIPRYSLTQKGRAHVEHHILPKLLHENIPALQEEIALLSTYSAKELSSDEHGKLLVDHRHRLVQRVNEMDVELTELYNDLTLPTTTGEVTHNALVEFCHLITRYLRHKRFIHERYDFEAYMQDYYLLYIIYKDILPYLKQRTIHETKTQAFYEYVLSITQEYPFSVHNPNLKELVACI